MNYSIRSLMTGAALASLSLMAQADVVVPVGSSYNGAAFNGTTVAWDYSSTLVDGFNAMATNSQPIDPATINQTIQYDPLLDETTVSAIRITAPVAAIGVNDSSQITSLYLDGGVKWTTPRLPGVARGGSLSITNLHIDLSNKQVYASITGNFTGAATGVAGTQGGAITTLDNFQLWNINTVSGTTAWPTFYADLGSGVPGIAVSGLSLTQNGYNHVVSALGLVNLGKIVLSAVNDEGFGTISTPVPEVSSVAMATSGIAWMAFMARRRTRVVKTHEEA